MPSTDGPNKKPQAGTGLPSDLGFRFQLHPWHGISAGEEAPAIVNVFVEVVPTDRLKYELDKESGHLKVDRPQLGSNVCPANYGFIPQTFCDSEVAALAQQVTGNSSISGDRDPLDILVLSHLSVQHGNVLLEACPIGGFRMIDDGEADDKIIAVLRNDPNFGQVEELSDVDPKLVAQLRHYFETYKVVPGASVKEVEIAQLYDRDEARRVIECSQRDYQREFLQ